VGRADVGRRRLTAESDTRSRFELSHTAAERTIAFYTAPPEEDPAGPA